MLKKILGLLGWLGVALVFAAVAIRNLRPEWGWWYGLAIAGLVCVLLYVMSQWREIARDFSGRQARHGSLAAASILVVLGILGAINYLAERHNKRWDLTAASQYTLSEQTKKVVQGLTKPVRVTVFARTEDFDRFRTRLDEYAYLSKNFQIDYVDPEKRPSAAEQLKESGLGTILMQYEGREQRVTSEQEQDLTNGLIKLLQDKEPKIYFVQGHGERDLQSSAGDGFGGISAELKGDHFATEPLTLLQQDVPADASVVVLAGPKTDLADPELAKLKAYLAKGGKLLAMIDPPQRADSAPLTNIIALAKEWGVDLGNNAVLDPLSQLRGAQADVPVAAPPYPYHAITNTFRYQTAFPYTRSVKPIEGGTNGHVATSIVMSGRNSWAETDLKTLMAEGSARQDPASGDVPGPVSLAVAVSAPVEGATPPPPADGGDAATNPNKPETRVVVVGDSDFVSNAVGRFSGNTDMFLNMVNWLSQQENMIAVRPRNPEDRRISVTAGQDRVIFWFAVFVLPGLVFLAGIQSWWRRR
ncbi:MAG TPA: Gldg family protein [Vicinamibacterales bacterium]|jgi:ABC-type uncharacterized transport system involved in gliding motility auxiliary subunit